MAIKASCSGNSGDPLFQAATHGDPAPPNKETAKKPIVMEASHYGGDGDELFREYLDYNYRAVQHLQSLNLQGHGDPLLLEFARQWQGDDDTKLKENHPPEEMKIDNDDEDDYEDLHLDEFHFHGDPLFEEALKDHGQLKKKTKSEPAGATPLLGDHIWSLVDIIGRLGGDPE